MTPHGPILSVVLTSHNQLNPLKFTLLSLKDQAPDLDFEIVAVDCGSTDGSDQFLVAQAQSGAIPGLRPGDFRTVLNPGPTCRTSARNQGAHQTRGRYLMFLDPGVVLGPRWWAALVRTLERDPQVGAVAGKIILPDGRIDHAGLALLEWWDNPEEGGKRSEYGQRLSGRSILAGKPAEIASSNQAMQVQALAGEAVMVRAAAFFSVGGFSARVGRAHHQVKTDFAGDLAGMDLCLRLGSRGWGCIYRPETVMTRLRAGEPGREAGWVQSPKEQDIFNKTWLGRTRGDFRVTTQGTTALAGQECIHRYIEPVLAFGDPTTLVPGKLARGTSSVIVVTHNNLETTRRCLLALLAYTQREHELVFVDMASDDGTREYLEEMATIHHQVKFLAAKAETTRSIAQNQGLAAARGRNLVLLDSGAVVTPGWLDQLTTTADFHPRAGLVGPMTNRRVGLQQLGQTDYDETSLRGLNSFAAQVAERQGGKTDRVMRLGSFCLLIKRELLARIGGLDAHLNLGGYLDQDFSLRAQVAGYEALVARDCFVHCDAREEERDGAVQHQWEMFKTKWGVPAHVTLNMPLDLSLLMAGGYRADRHFQPLVEAGQAVSATATVRAAQEAHA